MWAWIRTGCFFLAPALAGPLAAQERPAAIAPASVQIPLPAPVPTIDRDRPDRLEPQIAPPPAAAPQPSIRIAPSVPSAAATLLTRLHYQGSSLPTARLDEATAALAGRPLTADTLQAIARALSAVYAKSDIAFYSVSIPRQLPAGGVLTVRLVEGRGHDYRVSGLSPSAPAGLIAAHMRRLMREAPLQRALSLLRDIPGLTVDAQVRKLAQPGDLPFTPERYQYYSLSHGTPVGSNGMTLTAQAAHMQTRSRDSRIAGEATLAGITLAYPLIRSVKSQVALTASLDGIDSSNYFLDIRFGDYRSRAVRLGASWSHADATSGYALSAVVSRGLNVLGAKPFTGFSETGFTKVNVQAVLVEPITGKLALKTIVKGQYSKDDLPVTERFALGGRGAGMAFRLGDRPLPRAPLMASAPG